MVETRASCASTNWWITRRSLFKRSSILWLALLLLQRCFQTCSWCKWFSFYSLLYFSLLNFIDPALIYVHGRFGASLICMRNSEGSVGDRRQQGSQWQQMAQEARKLCLRFTNTCSHFCSRSYHQPERQPRRGVLTSQAATQWGAAPAWHLELRGFGFSSGHSFIAGWGAERFPPMQRRHQPVTRECFNTVV